MSKFRPSERARAPVLATEERGPKELARSVIPHTSADRGFHALKTAATVASLPSGFVAASDRKRFATLALAGYGCILTSYLNEYVSEHVIQMPLVAITYALILVVYFAAGDGLRFLRSPLAAPWIALLIWWALCSVFGFYPRRSVTTLYQYAARIHFLPFIFCAIAVQVRGVTTVIRGVALGLVAMLYFCVTSGTMWDDRFVVSAISFGMNANDLALHLILSGCLFIVFFRGNKGARILAGLVLPVTLYYVLKTGSRGNFVTLIVLFAFVLFLLPARKKLMVIALSAIVPVAIFPMLPQRTVDRLMTFFTVTPTPETANDPQLSQAVDSANARIQLQKRAIQLTREHPIFGIGMLNFEDAVDEMVRKTEGHKSGWQVSHNTYLQVSSEEGVPGLILWVWVIVLCLRTNLQIFRKASRDPSLRALALVPLSLLMATLTFAVGTLFCSIAYDYYLALLVALTASVELAFRQSEADVRAAPGQFSVVR